MAASARVSGTVSTEPAVLAFWHEYNLAAAVVAHRRRRDLYHVSFSTRGFRGQIMNAMLAALDAGSLPLPAPNATGEAARLSLEMARLGREGTSPVVSPDGPFGPYRRARPGAIIVARESGQPIQPWAVAVRPPLRLGGRWDRHIVPLPFSRIHLEAGEPLNIGPGEPLRPRLAALQAALDAVTARADRRMD